MRSQMNHVLFRFNFLTSNDRLLKRMLFATVMALCIDAEALSLCYVAVGTHESNVVYYVQDRQGSTNMRGVAEYLDRCVACVSTNLCVHVKIDKSVPFSDVFPLLKACKERNLCHLILYWLEREADEERYRFQPIMLLGDTRDPRMQPIVDAGEFPIPRKTTQGKLENPDDHQTK